jgi:hypothetical protein
VIILFRRGIGRIGIILCLEGEWDDNVRGGEYEDNRKCVRGMGCVCGMCVGERDDNYMCRLELNEMIVVRVERQWNGNYLYGGGKG